MALVLADRIRETTTTTGTGTITLAGAVTGYRSFATVGNANTTYYTIAGQNTSEWEVGIGTYTAAGTTLSRTTVLASSNAGSLVTFSAGTKDVFVTYPAGKSIYRDENGVVNFPAPSTSGSTIKVNTLLSSGGQGVTVYDSTVAHYIQLIAGSSAQTVRALDSLTLRVLNTDYLTIGGSGNITIAAPSSGVALTLTGVSTSNVINVNTAAGATPIQVSDGTATSWWFTNGASGVGFGTQTAHALSLYTTNSARLQITSGGNVTINAPTSGAALDARISNSANGIVALIRNDASASQNGAQFQFSQNAISDWAIGQPAGVNAFAFWAGRSTGAAGTEIMRLAGAGNVTINAPSSGTALTIAGLTGQNVLSARILGATNNPGLFVTPTESTGQVDLNISGSAGSPFATISTGGAERIRIANPGNVTINAPTSGTALTVNGDANLTGGLQLGSTAQNAIYKGGTDFFIARNYSQQYTVWEVWAPPSSNVLTDNREATLALVREDTSGNAEFIDIYNNGYPTGSPVSVQYGIRIQKRGTGQYRPFVIDQYDGTTYSPILDIAANRNVTISAPVSGTTLTVNNTSGNYWFNGTDGTSSFTAYSSSGVYMGTTSNHSLTFYTNGYANQRMTIGSGGNVSINAPTSGKALTITGVSADAQLQFGNGSGQGYLYGSGGSVDIISGSTSWPLRLGFGTGTMSTECMRVTGQGGVQITDTAGTLFNAGYLGVPQNSQTSAYALALVDRGKHISITTGGVTVNASIFSAGDAVTIYNNSSSSQTITQGTSVTMYLGGTATTGNRTLAQRGVCTVLCVASNTFVISGAGLT